MKVKIFYGTLESVQKAFNQWAKGKALSRNIIIHSAAYPAYSQDVPDLFAIFVYYPEGSQFDTESKQK
jgi:hypothetical protein